VRTTSIRQAQDVRRKSQQQIQDAHTSNLLILSGWVAAHYWSTVSYLPKTAITLLPQTGNVSAPTIRPLEGNQFGGGGSLSALNDCTKSGTGNYVSQGQDFPPIWCLQCTVLYDLIASVYKEILKIGKITFCIPLSIVSEPMATNREIDDLVREFEQEGLITCSTRPPATAHCEAIPPEPPRPMQTRSARKRSRVEVRTKRNQDRPQQTGQTLAAQPMEPSGSAQDPTRGRENIPPPRPPYLPPVRPGTTLPRRTKQFTLATPSLPAGVQLIGSMTGKIDRLKYSDHDTNDYGKFP